MLNQFSRTTLIFGKEAMEKLAESKIAIFGVGGVGGFAAESLVRSGVGAIDIIDDDKVCPTNLNRQIFATHKTVGKFKTEAAYDRLHEINPNCEITQIRKFFTPENSDEFDFTKYSYIIDAVDTVSAKIEIVVKANKCHVPVISSMGAGNKIDPTAFKVSDIYKTKVDPLAKVMRYELKRRRIRKLKVVWSAEKPIKPVEEDENSCRTQCICPSGTKRKCSVRRDIPGSNAFVPPVVGMIIAGEVIKDITGKKAVMAI